MATADELRRAQELYGAGAFSEAEAILKALVSGDSRNVDAWKGLGLVQRQQGRNAESIAAYERALALKERDAETHVNIAVALKAAQAADRALRHLERAIALEPRLLSAYLNLGNLLLDKDDLDRAGAAYLQGLKLDPRATGAALGLAKVFRAQKKPDMAAKTLQAAVKLVPGSAEMLAALGDVQHELGHDDDAVENLAAALDLAPQAPAVLHYAARVRRQRGDWDEAEHLLRRALDIVPDDADTLVHLAETLTQTGKRDEATRVLERARQIHANDPDVRFSCAVARLIEGQFAEGWPDYAYRTRTKELHAARFCHLPLLKSFAGDARKVVVWGDQGIGDEIIYGGFLQDLRAEGGRIVCELDRRLVPLFQRGFPEITFVERSYNAPLPRDVADAEAARVWRGAQLDARFAGATHQIALPDLGGLVRNDAATFPRHTGYLRADPGRVAAYRRMLDKKPGERIIGVSWRSQRGALGRAKSASLTEIVGALAAPGIRFVSLQYGDVAADIEAVRKAGLPSVDVAEGLDCFNDMEGLAALIGACDAVVTVSNVTAHLAGATGQTTGLLCATQHPWYWLRRGRDCPWYPSLQIFRQERESSWTQALAECRYWLLGD